MKKYIIAGFISIVTIGLILFSTLSLEEIQNYETEKIKHMDLTEVYTFNCILYPKKYQKITLEGADSIKEVYIKTGSFVKKGDILVQLDDSAQNSQYQSAWNTFNQLASTRNDLQTLESVLNEGQNYDTQAIRDILAQNGLTNDEINNIINTLNLSSNSQTSNIELTSLVQSSINSTYQQMQIYQEQIQSRKIVSPFDGTILFIQTDKSGNTNTSDLSYMGISIPSDSLNSMSESSTLNPTSNENFILIADTSGWSSNIKVKERDLLRIKQDMQIYLTSLNTKEIFYTKVENVYSFPDNLGSEEPIYTVTFNIDIKDSKISFGSNLKGEIIINQKQNVLVTPIDSLIYENNETYVNILSPTGTTKSKVITGIQNDYYIEIINGISENDEVITDILKPTKKITTRSWLKKLFKQ